MTTTITGALGIDNIKAATGAVLQVVQASNSTSFVTSSTSFVDTPNLGMVALPLPAENPGHEP